MNKLILNLVVIVAVAATAMSATAPVQQCSGKNFEGLNERITITPCGNKRCKLIKASNTTVEFRFKPTEVVNSLENNVYAVLIGVPLPFIGVTGTSACKQIILAATGEPAPCPLQPGVEYIYTNVFPIESFYPETTMIVHWSLNDGNKTILCFEVPAQITKSKH